MLSGNSTCTILGDPSKGKFVFFFFSNSNIVTSSEPLPLTFRYVTCLCSSAFQELDLHKASTITFKYRLPTGYLRKT